jgi:hypothetical protein
MTRASRILYRFGRPCEGCPEQRSTETSLLYFLPARSSMDASRWQTQIRWKLCLPECRRRRWFLRSLGRSRWSGARTQIVCPDVRQRLSNGTMRSFQRTRSCLKNAGLVKELLQLVEARAERPPHAFAGIDRRRGLSERKLEPGKRLDQITFFVVDDDRAAVAPTAIGRIGH